MGLFEESSSIFNRAKYLQSIGQSFTLKRVNNTYTLQSDLYGVKKSKNNYLKPAELTFIRKVQKYVQENAILSDFMDLINENDIRYISVNKTFNKPIYNSCIEIDLDEAYWLMAKNKGVISEDIYEFGKKEAGNLTKYGRLVALGSLAKKTYYYTFVNGMLRKKSVARKWTENIWFTICAELAEIMTEAEKIAGNTFSHYWVDGIYLLDPSDDIVFKIKQFFDSKGFNTKTKQCSIEITDDNIFVHYSSEPKPKPFFRPKHKKRNISPELLLDFNDRIKKLI